jgi:hypothetical protein
VVEVIDDSAVLIPSSTAGFGTMWRGRAIAGGHSVDISESSFAAPFQHAVGVKELRIYP